MDFLFIFLIKSSLSLMLLYLSYEFFFRKEAYYKFSRYLLLATVFIVIILPLLPYNAVKIASVVSNTFNEVIIYSNIATFTLEEVVIRAKAPWFIFINGISFGSILFIIYLLGVLFKIFQFSLRVFQLWAIIMKSETLNIDGLKFVYTAKGTPTFSFLNWIFIDSDLRKNNAEFAAILAHEKIHAQQGHTYDLFLAELLTIIQWFNPFSYLFRKSIKENHEYITDHEVISHYQDFQTYQLVLLQHSSNIKTNILTHNFSYSLLKRRLNIMKKTKTHLDFSLRLALLSISALLIFFACSSPEEKTNKELVITALKPEKAATTFNEDPVFTVVEEMPQFVGGEEAMYKFIGSNINYPIEAKKEGIQGRVVVTFIIEKDGQISNVEILSGIGGGCDEESIRVIKNMPKWIAGKQRGENVRVAYNLPFKFNLQ